MDIYHTTVVVIGHSKFMPVNAKLYFSQYYFSFHYLILATCHWMLEFIAQLQCIVMYNDFSVTISWVYPDNDHVTAISVADSESLHDQ